MTCVESRFALYPRNFTGQGISMSSNGASSTSKGLTYADSGVDIDAGDALVDRQSNRWRRRRVVQAPLLTWAVGGAFDLKAAGYDDPILISGTDGVGTKLKLAIATGKLDTVGIDLVGMCVNDILAQGAERSSSWTIWPRPSWTRRVGQTSSPASQRAAAKAVCADWR